jgi:hypothetical protein
MGLGNIGILYVNVWWIMHLLKKLEDVIGRVPSILYTEKQCSTLLILFSTFFRIKRLESSKVKEK